MDAGNLYVEQMGCGYAWLDTGAHDSLLEASEFVRTLRHHQGIQIACLEEIAFEMGFITAERAREAGERFKKTAYGRAIPNAGGDAGLGPPEDSLPRRCGFDEAAQMSILNISTRMSDLRSKCVLSAPALTLASAT
jgi:hypothetical protein